MPTYYFDMQDGVPVRDRRGLTFASNGQAIEHSKLLARGLREKPAQNKDLHVVVLDESGKEIHREAVHPARD